MLGHEFCVWDTGNKAKPWSTMLFMLIINMCMHACKQQLFPAWPHPIVFSGEGSGQNERWGLHLALDGGRSRRVRRATPRSGCRRLYLHDGCSLDQNSATTEEGAKIIKRVWEFATFLSFDKFGQIVRVDKFGLEGSYLNVSANDLCTRYLNSSAVWRNLMSE